MTRPNKSSYFYFLGGTPNKLIESHTITTQPIRHHSRISIRAPHRTAQITLRPQPHFFSLPFYLNPSFCRVVTSSHQDDTATQIKPKPVSNCTTHANSTAQEQKKGTKAKGQTQTARERVGRPIAVGW